MKVKYLYKILISLISFLHITNLFAQSLDYDIITEKSTGGETYIIKDDEIYNKKNILFKDPSKICLDGGRVYESSSIDEIFKEVLSEKKVKSLENKRMGITYFCDSSGAIKEIKFLMNNIKLSSKESELGAISIIELNKIENRLKKCRLKIDSNCPSMKYIPIGKIINFNRLTYN